jgi:hypothetical protein
VPTRRTPSADIAIAPIAEKPALTASTPKESETTLLTSAYGAYSGPEGRVWWPVLVIPRHPRRLPIPIMRFPGQ